MRRRHSRALLIAALTGAAMMGSLTAAHAAEAESCLSMVKEPDNAAAAQPADQAPSATDRILAKAANDISRALGPDKAVTAKELKMAVPVDAIENPAQSLSTAEITSCGGEPLGTVKSVDVKPDGTARAIRVSSGGFLGFGDRIVAVDADRFAYLKDRNLLVTDLSKNEIKAMPKDTAMR